MKAQNLPPSSESHTPIEQLTYEQAFTELEKIVNELEVDNQSLENSLALFERGQALIRYCTGLLGKAELRIQQISNGELTEFTPEN